MNNSGPIEETIFDGARQLPTPDEREAYLDRACGGDRALRERVERMLHAEQQADQFLAGNPLEVDETALWPAGGEAVGATIGRYKLLQQIGEGGCGIVYMAEQEKPIRRRVALKVIKPGMDTRQVIARFEAERQAVSMMDHPNIARVLDAGATEAGRPYFVMELVRGIRITEYCDQNNLSTRERLELFTKVVQAVQHAHQKGIIHRDIKPSNVLITLHDGVPVPKVIDFGIAKALEQKLTDKTLFTVFEQFIGTPAYTSPEQAEMSGLDIDTRSDIYSLGVLLYELLVGRTPFEAEDLLHSGLNEMRRIIREQEPARPSTRLSIMMQGDSSTAAQHRRISAPQLIHLLKGDLDWVVMKCLEKDRTRRYETANGLANDIQRYLSQEPVTARPPSNLYRFGKLVRRNRLAFAAAAAVTLALVAGIVVSRWQAERARSAEQLAKDEKNSAEAVLQFFRDKVMAAGRPEGQEGGLGRNVTLRRAVDSAESQIAEAFKDRPLVEAAIRQTIGTTYSILGEDSLAVPQLERALALQQHHLGLGHADTLRSMVELRIAYNSNGVGKPDQALQLLEQIVEIQKDKVGPNSPDFIASMTAYGFTYLNLGEVDQALPIFEEAVKRAKVNLGLGHPITLNAIQGFSFCLFDCRKTNEIEEFLAQAVQELRKVDPKNAALLKLRGDLRARRGQFKSAAADFSEAIQMQPGDHRLYHHLTVCLIQDGDLEPYRENCRQIVARFAEATEPEVGDRMAKDCSILPSSGVDLAVLERWTDCSLAAGEAHWASPWFLLSKGMVQYRRGSYANAAETMQKAIDKDNSRSDPERAVSAWMVLAMAHLQLGERDRADSALARGLELADTELPKIESGDLGVFDSWVDWPIAQALMCEARSLIQENSQ